jgi:hypothetical protein
MPRRYRAPGKCRSRVLGVTDLPAAQPPRVDGLHPESARTASRPGRKPLGSRTASYGGTVRGCCYVRRIRLSSSVLLRAVDVCRAA